MTSTSHAAGERSVAIGGDLKHSIIQTGDTKQYVPTRLPVVDAATLAAATHQLAQLSHATIPPPVPLPPGSRMLLTRNPLFVGREHALQWLAQAVGGSPTSPVATAVVAGLGGVGKTQLTSEFVHRYGQYFASGIFWLDFTNAANVPAEVVEGATAVLEVGTDWAALPLAQQVAWVQQAWQSALPRLLVFDNCEDEALLTQWRPPSGGCRVLVTSRRAVWDVALGMQVVALGVLRRAESIALLRKHRPDLPPDDTDLNAMAEELGDLPLALHLAGSFLARYRHAVTPAAYLVQLHSPTLLKHRSFQSRGVSPTKRQQDVARTFALSYERLDAANPTDRLALALLARAAHFARGVPIPRALLLATLQLAPDDPDAALQAQDALTRLVELGLLEEEAEGALRLHRLLAAFVRATATDTEAQDAVEEALLDEARRLSQGGYPVPLLALQPHLRAVTEAASQRADERAASLCNTLAYHLHMIGDYAAARPLFERALQIREQVQGPAHPDTASSLNNLAELLRAQGDYAAARPLYERALQIREQVLGPAHPDTAQSLNNLAMLLYAQGDYAAARPLYERALQIREQVLGPDHPDTAQSLNNLAEVLRVRGDYMAAGLLYERALRIWEQVLGPDHLSTAIGINNLALLRSAQGDYTAARSLLKRALNIIEPLLGPNHAWTLAIRSNLAAIGAARKSTVE